MKKIYVSKKEKYIDMIIESLKKQFEDKGEEIDIESLFCNDIEQADLCIIEEKDFLMKDIKRINPAKADKNDCKKLENLKSKKIILLIEEKLSGEVFDKFLDYEIIGIFRKKRLEYEYEELGKFEKLLKDYIREIIYGMEVNGKNIYKKIPYKNIRNWKFFPKADDIYKFYEKNKYISIFLDPAMKDFSRKLRQIIRDFKKAREKYKEKFDFIEEKLKDKGSNDKLRKLDEELSKINDKIFLPSLLIEGETGTGKSLIAEIISTYISGQVYRISLANITKNLIDSELFGTREGAYTDARDRKGKILNNVGKCIFLDEIAEVPDEVQVKLLLYLDDFKIRPEGYDGTPLLAPAFIIAATNKDLKKEVNKESFRKDLYYRFKYKIKIPSLKERREDLRFLINFILLNPYINHYDEEKDKYLIEKISLAAIQKLENYDYPGNFRELEGILKNAINLAVSEGLDIILDKHISY